MKLKIEPQPGWPSLFVIKNEACEPLANNVSPELAGWVVAMAESRLCVCGVAFDAPLDQHRGRHEPLCQKWPEFGTALTGPVEVEV